MPRNQLRNEYSRLLLRTGTTSARVGLTATLLFAAAIVTACGSSSSSGGSKGTGGNGVPSTGTGGAGEGGIDNTTGTHDDAATPSTGSGGKTTPTSNTTPTDSGAGGTTVVTDATTSTQETSVPDVPEDCVITVSPGTGGSDSDAALVEAGPYDQDSSPFGHGTGGATAAEAGRPPVEAGVSSTIDRKNWKVVEVSSYFNNGEVDKPEYAFDGDRSTRWATGVAQADNADPALRQRILIDMGARQKICRLVIDSQGPDNKSDQAKEFDIYISDTPTPNDVTFHGMGTPMTEIQFPQVQRGRYLGIVNRGSDASLWWSIFEVNAYH